MQHGRYELMRSVRRNSAAVIALPKTGVPASKSFARGKASGHHWLEAGVLNQAHRDLKKSAAALLRGTIRLRRRSPE